MIVYSFCRQSLLRLGDVSSHRTLRSLWLTKSITNCCNPCEWRRYYFGRFLMIYRSIWIYPQSKILRDVCKKDISRKIMSNVASGYNASFYSLLNLALCILLTFYNLKKPNLVYNNTSNKLMKHPLTLRQ